MTDVDESQDMPWPYLTDPGYELRMTGRWADGGLLEIRYRTKKLDLLELSPPEWGVLALLIKATQRSSDGHWALGFLSTKKLARELRRLAHRGSGSSGDVHRAINRLRTLLDRSVAAGLQLTTDQDETSFGKRLVEKRPKFGYRISLPPQQLHLTELADDTEPDPETA